MDMWSPMVWNASRTHAEYLFCIRGQVWRGLNDINSPRFKTKEEAMESAEVFARRYPKMCRFGVTVGRVPARGRRVRPSGAQVLFE